MATKSVEGQQVSMSDAILSSNDRQEALSRAYVQAIAGAAGYSTGRPDFDRDSVDITIDAGGAMRPRLDAQLKATTNVVRIGSAIHFPLGIKNYNDLRVPTQTPRILIVMEMPKEEKDWVTITVEQLILRKAAYWMSLLGMSETENDKSVTVSIPVSNVFDVSALTTLMELSRQGKLK